MSGVRTPADRHVLGVVALALVACGDGDGVERSVTAERCRVDLHGKGDQGADPALVDGVAVLRPDGNGDGWGGREWRYDDPDDRAAAIDIVRRIGRRAPAATGSRSTASRTAPRSRRRWCARARRSTAGSSGWSSTTPSPTPPRSPAAPTRRCELALYWTGALDDVAPPGTDCATVDWTCAGGTVRGIDVFAADLGVERHPQPVRRAPSLRRRPRTGALAQRVTTGAVLAPHELLELGHVGPALRPCRGSRPCPACPGSRRACPSCRPSPSSSSSSASR